MPVTGDYTIWAVKAPQPWEESAYWIPQIHREIESGRARFGWGWTDLREIESRLDSDTASLSEDDKWIWSHAAFLLTVKPEDVFVYINMPEYGRCTAVRIEGHYEFSDKWAEEDDFRHLLPCGFLASFDRNDDTVPPYLSQRLKLQGSHYRINCKKEFTELLDALRSASAGRTALSRLQEMIDRHLQELAEETHRQFPAKSLERLLIRLFERMPCVTAARRGPDRNGADIEIEFERAPGLGTLQGMDLCAVQAKSYSGTMDYDRAIHDIERAFESNPDYTCGLIVSTALELTEEFEKKLQTLREATGKSIGVLVGRDLAQLVVAYGLLPDMV